MSKLLFCSARGKHKQQELTNQGYWIVSDFKDRIHRNRRRERFLYLCKVNSLSFSLFFFAFLLPRFDLPLFPSSNGKPHQCESFCLFNRYIETLLGNGFKCSALELHLHDYDSGSVCNMRIYHQDSAFSLESYVSVNFLSVWDLVRQKLDF